MVLSDNARWGDAGCSGAWMPAQRSGTPLQAVRERPCAPRDQRRRVPAPSCHQQGDAVGAVHAELAHQVHTPAVQEQYIHRTGYVHR